jgi:hypothetical protein
MSNFSISNSHTNAAALNRPAAATGDSASASASNAAPANTASLADFNERAGVAQRGQPRAVQVLSQRRLGQPARTAAMNRQRRSARKERSGDIDELEMAGTDALEMLEQDGRSSLEEDLAERYDVLEQYAVLNDAREQLQESARAPDEKATLLAELEALEAQLMAAHGAQIDAGKQAAQAMDMTLEMLAEQEVEAHSTDELRQMLGAKAQGRRQTMLTPLDLLKTMQMKFGSANFGSALQSLQSKFGQEMRGFKQRSAPQLWMSMADANSFTTIRNGFAMAAELRGNLSEQANITAGLDQVALTVALLELPTLPAATPLLNMLAEPAAINAQQQEKLLRLLHQTIAALPTTWWEQDALPQRLQLLEELYQAMVEHGMRLPGAGVAPEDSLEAQLRQRLAASA